MPAPSGFYVPSNADPEFMPTSKSFAARKTRAQASRLRSYQHARRLAQPYRPQTRRIPHGTVVTGDVLAAACRMASPFAVTAAAGEFASRPIPIVATAAKMINLIATSSSVEPQHRLMGAAAFMDAVICSAQPHYAGPAGDGFFIHARQLMPDVACQSDIRVTLQQVARIERSECAILFSDGRGRSRMSLCSIRATLAQESWSINRSTWPSRFSRDQR